VTRRGSPYGYPLRVASHGPYQGADGRWYLDIEVVDRRGVHIRRLSGTTPLEVLGLVVTAQDRIVRKSRPNRLRRVTGVVTCFGLVVLALVGFRPLLASARTRSSRSRDHESVAPPGVLDTPQVTSYLATRQGDITMALYDAVNGQTYLYRPGVTETTASIIKVDILSTLLYHAQQAHQPLSAETAALATTMIVNSNDNAAQVLWNQEGGSSAVGAFDRLAGTTDTDLNTHGYWGLSTTTAADQLKLLKTVAYPNALVDNASRAYELGLMEGEEADQLWGVSGGVPSGVTVALKDGWDPLGNGTTWQINSIGWVDGDSRNYLFAVLTNGDGSESYGIQTIEGVSGIVWDELAPPPPPTSTTSVTGGRHGR
jgi:hypothetical protein